MQQGSKILGECLSCPRVARWWSWSRIRCQLRRHLVVKTRVGYPAVRKAPPWWRLRRGPSLRTSRVDPDYLCQIGRCSHDPGVTCPPDELDEELVDAGT